MKDIDEIPIGFTMELAMHQDAFAQFSSFPETRKQEIVERARSIHSHREMERYIEQGFTEHPHMEGTSYE